ncbi:MAG TPA: hypothetical protein VGL53_12085, partial [Bryobacteraceae bacterium]
TNAKSAWLGCYRNRRLIDTGDYEYGNLRLPPRYLVRMNINVEPHKDAMANPFVTAAHIEELVKQGYLTWRWPMQY